MFQGGKEDIKHFGDNWGNTLDYVIEKYIVPQTGKQRIIKVSHLKT